MKETIKKFDEYHAVRCDEKGPFIEYCRVCNKEMIFPSEFKLARAFEPKPGVVDYVQSISVCEDCYNDFLGHSDLFERKGE